MGWNFHKSIKVGPARINLSKSGVGYSIGARGFRFTKRASSKKKGSKETGCLGSCLKGMFYLLALAIVAYLVATHWKLLVALVAIAVIAAVGYWIYLQKLSRPRGGYATDPHDSDPASE